LYQNGFEVEGIDISETAIKKIITKFEKLGVSIQVDTQDARNFIFKNKYDIIISACVLQLFAHSEIEVLINDMKTNTCLGGLNVISSFTSDNPFKYYPYQSPDGTYKKYCLFNSGELKDYYSDWNILEYSEYETGDHKHGEYGQVHKHCIVSMIAEKKSIKGGLMV
jgi:tellurite methyltransferase